MFHLFREKCSADKSWKLFWLVLESHGKVMEIDFPKRVVTLNINSGAF